MRTDGGEAVPDEEDDEEESSSGGDEEDESEDWEAEESASASSDEDEESEEGKSWDELEREAEHSDRTSRQLGHRDWSDEENGGGGGGAHNRARGRPGQGGARAHAPTHAAGKRTALPPARGAPAHKKPRHWITKLFLLCLLYCLTAHSFHLLSIQFNDMFSRTHLWPPSPITCFSFIPAPDWRAYFLKAHFAF